MPGLLPTLGVEAETGFAIVSQVLRFMQQVESEIATELFTKADSSPVSAADFAIQAFVASRLAPDGGDLPLIAEEDSTRLRADAALLDKVTAFGRRLTPELEGERLLEWIDRGAGPTASSFWTLDPIDGTKGLLHGRQYVTALALIREGRVQLGVIGCPRLSVDGTTKGGIAVAVRNRGAWWTSSCSASLVPLHVSVTAELSAARVIRSWEDAHGDTSRLERVLHAGRSRVPPCRMDSQAKHVAVAAGLADVLFRLPPSNVFHEAVWDCAAGALLVEEAGGRITDLDGAALDFGAGRRLVRNRGYVASNGALHAQALEAIHRSG